MGRFLILLSSSTAISAALLGAACGSEGAVSGAHAPEDGGHGADDAGNRQDDASPRDGESRGGDAVPVDADRNVNDATNDRRAIDDRDTMDTALDGGVIDASADSRTMDARDSSPVDTNEIDRGGDSVSPRDAGDATVGGATPQIPMPALPTVETDTFTPSSSTTDIADDSAIYANPAAPELSVVIADNKDDGAGGIGVFDMQGKLLQFRQDGKIGNVDLRAGFPLGGQSIVLVGANNRSNDTLIFWQLDPTTRQLSAPIGETIATTSPNYGFCLYHSAMSGKFYAFVTQETGAATMEQYELGENGGKITGTKVRSFDVGSITEGCVADDELGRLYVAQEDVALWRYDAEPAAGSARTQVGAVGDGHLVMDLEGVSLAKGPGTSGYLVLSLQGESRFVTFDRETNAYIREFTVGANGSIDATSQTDGLDISTADLGPGFSRGMLVVHDGSNTGGAASNLKYVPLQ